MATRPLPSPSPNSVEYSIWQHGPSFLGVLIVERQQYGYTRFACSGGESWGKLNMATYRLHLRSPIMRRKLFS